ncbi:MAG: hypothetical protein GY737_10660 [Desulfobacteraceae bacterium]|nr:hypothetical protein [Desulfobacteraceae bacterium]
MIITTFDHHEEESVRQTFGHVQEKTENFFHFQKTESVIIVVWRFRVCMKKQITTNFSCQILDETRCIIVLLCCYEFMGNVQVSYTNQIEKTHINQTKLVHKQEKSKKQINHIGGKAKTI